ncbi:hypothetical protein Q3G72_028295 [Acer saccharum]|nr:hypothetical protein Q3G72_028295 [Acer saccharum]
MEGSLLQGKTDMVLSTLGQNNHEAIKLKEKIDRSFCMYKMPSHIFNVRKFSIPIYFSIGPYHGGKRNLHHGEIVKWYFLQSFILRSGRDVSELLSALNNIVTTARNCYSEDVNMNISEFLEMLLVDGSFLIEVLCYSSKDQLRRTSYFKSQRAFNALFADLVKLENQIPLKVLKTLYEISETSEVSDLQFLSAILKHFEDWHGLTLKLDSEFVNCEHLLALLSTSLFPKPEGIGEETQIFTYSLLGASELCKSGVSFRSKEAHNLLDIVYEKQVLYIPPVCIDEVNKTLLINCVSLELCEENLKQCEAQERGKMKCCSDYMSFLSLLINRPRDVAILCQSGIIAKSSQQDQCISKFFKDFAKMMALDSRHSCLRQQLIEIERYHGSTIARLHRGSIYSIVVILCAITQTVMAILSYFKA